MASAVLVCCTLQGAASRAALPPSTSYSFTRLPRNPKLRTSVGGNSSVQHQGLQRQQNWRRRQRRQQLAATAGNSGGSSTRNEDEKDIYELALQEYDKFIDNAKAEVEISEGALKELQDELGKMRQEGVLPGWFVSWAAWATQRSQLTVAGHQQRYAALTSRRDTFASTLRTLRAELEATPPARKPDATVAEWLALTGYTWAVEQKDGTDAGGEELQRQLREAVDQTSGPSTVLSVCVCYSLFTAWLAGLAGSWAGYDAYRLLHDAPSAAATASWLAWTAPYVLGTLATHTLAPQAFSKSIFRPLAGDQQTFFRTIPFTTYVTAAAVLAWCQCLVYQGLWQDVFTSALGGVRDPFLLADPTLYEPEELPMLGTLAGSLRLPAFVVAPSAAVLTAALEAYWFYLAVSLRDTSASFSLGGEQVQAKDWMEGPGGSLEPTTITTDERVIICTRVALASAWLAVETTVTGSLWLAAGTSAAGMITSVLLSRRSAGASAAR